MNYWIQKTNYDAVEGEVNTSDEAMRIFNETDWEKELELQEKLEEMNEDNCDPGFGLLKAGGFILHLCPGVNNSYFHYHFDERSKILGIFPTTRERLISKMKVPREDLITAIKKYFNDDHNWFLQYEEG